MSKRLVSAAFVAVLLHGSVLCAQEQPGDSHDMSQMNTPAADVSNSKIPELHELFGMGTDGSAHAMHSMQSHHMETGPEHPTSLLYEKQGTDYKLIGVMYTAPKKATEDELDRRIPLSIAQWHAHINMCIPPAEKKKEMWGPNPGFGLAGTIATKVECKSAGGKFVPQIFGWMVHVYPFEQKAEDVWSVQRQTAAHAD